ncbi:MAG: hypothetical protein IPJ69_00575 [Deltaproteobacteria bacterium]|nr:MAG: hypothetical protein IPJ69_00575 [Deltaproteobacteria bacterium]
MFVLLIPSLVNASGGISGKVTYTGERLPVKKLAVGIDAEVCGSAISSEEIILGKRGELQNVVVYLSGKGLFSYKGLSQESPAVLTQEKCRFTPRVVFISPGQDLKVVNNDGILHNFHTESHANLSLNRAQPASMRELILKFSRSEIFTAICDVHSWMKSVIVVKDNPYYALTNEKGEYEIKDIPLGTYVLHFFHEKLGEKKQVIQIKEGETENVSIKMGIY